MNNIRAKEFVEALEAFVTTGEFEEDFTKGSNSLHVKYRNEIFILIDRLFRADILTTSTSPHVDPPENCDLCKAPLLNSPWFVDGAINGKMEWANMCQNCYMVNGTAIAWGRGQLYRREKDDRWLLVAGAQPQDEVTA